MVGAVMVGVADPPPPHPICIAAASARVANPTLRKVIRAAIFFVCLFERTASSAPAEC